jgi:hypothetical protein
MKRSDYKERKCFSVSRNEIGRVTAYKEIREGRLTEKNVGKRKLISLEEEARWFVSAPSNGGGMIEENVSRRRFPPIQPTFSKIGDAIVGDTPASNTEGASC